MKISVFTDLRFTESTTPTGVGKHIKQMVLGLTQLDGNAVSVLAASDQVNGVKLRPTSSLAGLPAQKLPFPWKTAEALWTLTGGPPVDRSCQGADWVYCPKNDFIPLRRTKLAVTIHGAHELDPAMPKSGHLYARLNRIRRRISYERIVSRADLVLTVSEFLKNQVIDWFGCAEEKIAVVGNGVDPVFFKNYYNNIANLGANNCYILCVGGLNYIDGGDRIVLLAEGIKSAGLGIRIKIAGNQHDNHLISRAMQTGIIDLLGYVPTNKLAPLMAHAMLLYYPSRYETFGIGAAEAMAVCTLVVTSRCTAIPEVVGNCGIYVDPDKPGDVVELIEATLHNPSMHKEKKLLARERANLFTWHQCVDKLNRTFYCS